MELYAGLVENVDYHVGRLVDHLKKIGEYENTIFIVFGDNGAEGTDLGAIIGGTPGTRDYLFFALKWSNNHPNAWGEPNSYVGYGPGWAQASMTPFSQYKGWMAEGGIRNALVVSGPINKLPKGSINHGLMYVADLMPTLIEVAGASYPANFNGKAQPKLIGKSWLPVLNGQAASPRTDKDYIAWEVFGNRALRQGDWKIRWEIKPMGKSDWELFNIAQDPGERNDLAAKNPDKVKEMLLLWDKYVAENNVIIPDRTVFETMEDQLPPRFPVQDGYPPYLKIQQFMPPQEMMAEPKEIIMKNYTKFISMRAGIFSIALVTAMLGVSISALAQGDGARFYWKGLMGTNAFPVIASSMGGNANPNDPSNSVIPESEFKSTRTMAGYAKMFPVGKRSAMVSLLAPMGNVSGTASLDGIDFSKTARGYGDPLLQFTLNVLGPKAIMNIPDVLRYQPKFSVDLAGSIAIPIGDYDNTSPINMGQNRWYGRIGVPIVWQIGAWVPGERTTLEFLPGVWLFGDNIDFVGKTMSTEPMIQLEGHLTRDFSANFWGSLDVISYTGGLATIDGVAGSSLNNLGIGGTLGYHINSSLQMNLSYSSTVNDKKPEDLKMDAFRLTLIYGFQSLIEGMNRLKGE